MGNVPRKADGRRVFNPDFKQATVQRILTGEKTVAELSREVRSTISRMFEIDVRTREWRAISAVRRNRFW